MSIDTLSIKALESAIVVIEARILKNEQSIQLKKERLENGSLERFEGVAVISSISISTLILRNRDLNRTKRSLIYLKENWSK